MKFSRPISRRDLLKAAAAGGAATSTFVQLCQPALGERAESGAHVAHETELLGRAYKNPYSEATAVWHLATLAAIGSDSLTLQMSGSKTVSVGQKLEGEEYA